MILRYSKYIQPVGFALLLIHFILVKHDTFMFFLWAGVACTLFGAGTEVYFFFRTLPKRRTQVLWVFAMGIVAKILLIAAIVLRVYDTPNSLFILLGCIVLSFIWFFLSQVVKPSREGHQEFLDVE